MEFLDFVNEKDEVIGRASKKEIYEKKLTHRIVHVFVFNKKGEMALQLQSKHKSFCPLHWTTAAAGHVRSSETYEQAGLRELEEEIGIKTDLTFSFKDFYGKSDGIRKFLGSFKATHNGPFQTNPIEVEKIEFFNLEEIQEMINKGEKFHPETLFLLRKHFGLN